MTFWSSSALTFLTILWSITMGFGKPTFNPLPSSHCPTSCGGVNFSYPFGIGSGCYRQGLQLECDANTNQLFLANTTVQALDFTSFFYPTVITRSIVATLSVDTSDKNISLIHLNPNAPFSFGRDSHVFVVIGCSATAHLVNDDTNTIIGVCSTVCPANSHAMQALQKNNITAVTCEGIGCCFIYFLPNTSTSLSVQLQRINSSDSPLQNSTQIKAFVFSDQHSFTYNDIFGLNGRNYATTSLYWYLNDEPNCVEAMRNKETYACLSTNSMCLNVTTDTEFKLVPYPPPSPVFHLPPILGTPRGYSCLCNISSFDRPINGNPYLPNGCLETVTTIPAASCSRKCGSIDIPFPFGVEAHCYRDEPFSLTCNNSASKTPTLIFNYGMEVDKILLEEGMIKLANSTMEEMRFQHIGYVNYVLENEGPTLNWVIDVISCNAAKQNMNTFACRSQHSSCKERNVTRVEVGQHLGYYCSCFDGYSGNPYLENGCTDINECGDTKNYPCYGICTNTEGNYTCKCKPGTHGDPKLQVCIKSQNVLLELLLGAGIGIGFLLAITSLVVLSKKWKKIKAKRSREKFFHQNHGLLLQQLISSTNEATTNTKIFSLEELEKATNNFDDTRIVGQGGHGTVYKGILSDQRVVAIKKSKIIIEREINQFINEVAILSQINHRNIVKLFGCCLETQVPLLIYEFIPNGTLFYHMHDSNVKTILSWSDRIRIATEAAGALSYLHSAASISIFHRDIKSSNILLDEHFTVKVSDFGASRSIPTDKTRITTAIQGTFGYLDPEYYQTGQLTEKSDVYSFGVILLELLTRRKPTCPRGVEQDGMNLAMLFIQASRENRLDELIDDCILNDNIKEEINQMFELAKMCLKLKGEERPKMKAIEHTLQAIRRKKLYTKEWYGTEARENECLMGKGKATVAPHPYEKHYDYNDTMSNNDCLEIQSVSSIDQGR